MKSLTYHVWCVQGAEGVEEMLQIIKAEFSAAMCMAGT
jgi:hypothetical protein